jgi:hypothetical protein
LGVPPSGFFSAKKPKQNLKVSGFPLPLFFVSFQKTRQKKSSAAIPHAKNTIPNVGEIKTNQKGFHLK